MFTNSKFCDILLQIKENIMRVVAGKYRSKKLNEFSLGSTRPTLDRVKEAIFSSIQFDLLGAVVLDLFAGTGALGIEAISRGAKLTYFVDKEKKAIDIIKSNLKGITEDYKVCFSDYLKFLNDNMQIKFNVVLLDAPFNTDFAEKAIDILINNNMIADNGVIVFEKDYSKEYSKTFENYKRIDKKYGSVGVVLFRKVG